MRMQKKSKNDNFLNFFKSDLRSAKSLPAAGQRKRAEAGTGRDLDPRNAV
jgi:hypothetical protein